MSKNFLELENIHKTFPLPGGKEYKAVVDVNVKIAKNEIISIIGHSGCGKSTFLRWILFASKALIFNLFNFVSVSFSSLHFN